MLRKSLTPGGTTGPGGSPESGTILSSSTAASGGGRSPEAPIRTVERSIGGVLLGGLFEQGADLDDLGRDRRSAGGAGADISEDFVLTRATRAIGPGRVQYSGGYLGVLIASTLDGEDLRLPIRLDDGPDQPPVAEGEVANSFVVTGGHLGVVTARGGDLVLFDGSGEIVTGRLI